LDMLSFAADARVARTFVRRWTRARAWSQARLLYTLRSGASFDWK
jgi:hypothetical protein